MKKTILMTLVILLITSMGMIFPFGDGEADGAELVGTEATGEEAGEGESSAAETGGIEADGDDGAFYIKVGMRYGDTAQTKSVFRSPGGFALGKINQDGVFVQTLPLPAYTEVTASIEGIKVVLKDSKGVTLTHEISGDTYLFPYDDQEFITFESRRYRGGFNLKHFGGSKVTVINILPLEDYLYGVVHREMGQSNPAEALKAQAITARTYAVLNINRHRTSGFDICAGTHCQVYGGVNDEYESTVAAVDETEGLMIYMDGKPVDTYYSKNSGGHTQNSEDVWGTALAHVRGKPDPYCPDYPWHATIKYEAMRQMLKQGGLDPGNISRIEITERNSSLAVQTLVVSGSLGQVSLNKTKVRELFGASLIRSNHFTLNEEYVRPVGTLGENTFNLRAGGTGSSGSFGKNTSAEEPVYIMGGSGEVTRKSLDELWIHNGSRLSAMTEFIKEAQPGSFDDQPVLGGDSVTFYGLGYGHGVGMAQDGAIEMAKMGMTYMDILTFYYTDVEVY